MRIISFFSFKGGVGRTALLTNLGAHWAAQGRVVALMDLDLIAPGISYSPLLGPYLEPRAGVLGLGMGDLLATYHQKPPGETINFLPPSVLLREMKLPESTGGGGRLFAIGAGSREGGARYAQTAPAPTTGIIRAIPRAGADAPPDTGSGDASHAQSPEAHALRALAGHIREDLANWRLPPGNDAEPDPAAGRGIDYLLIDARTGFSELIDLSLGYLADHMVLVSGLNDQNMEGLRLTLDALQEENRVRPDELSTLVTVVFSPIPAGEDEALLDRLEYVHRTLAEKLRYTRSGQRELPPQTFTLHYTPLLAISERPILPTRPHSLYGKEARAIADHLAGELQGEGFRDELMEEARRRAMRLVESATGKVRAAPPPAADARRPNPLADLPAWDWPFGEESGADMRAKRFDELVGGLSHSVQTNPVAFLNLLAWSLSLSLEEKQRVFSSLPGLKQTQIDQLVDVFEQERIKFQSVWTESPSDIASLFVRCQREWAALVLEDESEANTRYLVGSLEEKGLFPNAESWPKYWLALARTSRERIGKDEYVLAAVDRAIGRAAPEERPTLAEELMEFVPMEAEDSALPAALEERARGIAPEHSWLDFLAARRLLEGHTRDLATAEKLLRSLLASPPEDARKCFRLAALVLDELPVIGAETETALRKAMELDPKFAAPWNSFGNLLKNQSRPEEAEATYRKAMELDPKFATPWNNLGNLLKNQSRPEEAEAAYRKAMELDPKYALPWYNLGNLLKSQSRPEEAEAAYHKAMELDPKNALPWNNLGNLLQNQSRPEEAEAAYRKAMELDHRLATPWNGLGVLLADHLGRPEEAEATYRKAMELDPKNATLWNNLGNLLDDHLNRPEEAEAAYRKAMELDPKYALPWNGLGLLQRDWQQDCEGALASFRAGLQRAAGDERAQAYLHMNLGHTLQLLGHPAREELAMALERFDGMASRIPDDNAHGLRLALELGDGERTEKYLGICREWAGAGRRGYVAIALTLAALVMGGEPGEEKTGGTDTPDTRQPLATQPEDWDQYWGIIQALHLLSGFRPKAREGCRAMVKALLALPDSVTGAYPDKPRPDWRTRYLPFAEGRSHGVGDPRERALFCGGASVPG